MFGYLQKNVTKWRSIETAPKDGRWIRLRGGSDKPVPFINSRQPNVDGPPEVVAFWHDEEKNWAYCHWDSDWRSYYDNPTEWAEIG